MSHDQAFPVLSSADLKSVMEGAVLLVDKPYRWTSFDVVGKIRSAVRRTAGISKFKVGHAGTLDPLATGLLVICTGKMTKQIQFIQAGEKEYTGTIVFGKTTASFDLESEPEGDFPTQHLTAGLLYEQASKMVGVQLQTPPVFSAKFVDGLRAYEKARRGESVEMRQHQIEISAFEVTRVALPEMDFRIRCSKGTYIRSIANDFGAALGSGSYLSALRRTESAPHRIENAWDLGDLLSGIRGESTKSDEINN